MAKPQREAAAQTSAGNKPKQPPPLRRLEKKKAAEPAILVAYDFETTRIEAGTPRPLHLTAYSDYPTLRVHIEEPINNMLHLRELLIKHFLTDFNEGVKFVAWNANNFDAYFVAAALIHSETYILRPYLTRSNALRGLRINLRAEMNEDGTFPKNAKTWEFLDGIAMLGLTGTPLKTFLKNFAPEFGKLTDVINFETEEFDSTNPAHREYALRDSVGLWYGMVKAQSILIEHFNQPLTVTMGGACIKIFQANIPQNLTIRTHDEKPLNIIREYVMRGGFCYCVKKYHGPVYKYDLNQAYAAAMREADLPAGSAYWCKGVNKYAKVYFAKVTAKHPTNIIPFYYRTESTGRLRSTFTTNEIHETWLTSIEINQLKSEGWKVNILEMFFYDQSFKMSDFVNGLEKLRTTCEGGPSGPIGTMVKAVGNHSYGKTVQQMDYIEYLMAADTPPGFCPFYGDNLDPLENIYFRFTPEDEIRPKAYEKPQLGAFITAHVRMVVRRAALLSPGTWLYADTDCVIFSTDVTDQLDIDPKRYGAWKLEERGTEYQIIAKKVYRNVDTDKLNAKGLNIKRLNPSDFDEWYKGNAPVQAQTQRNNFLTVMRGAEMYRTQSRSGTRVK